MKMLNNSLFGRKKMRDIWILMNESRYQRRHDNTFEIPVTSICPIITCSLIELKLWWLVLFAGTFA